MLDIKDFKDKHVGEPVALLCNGPSLLRYDLSTLPCKAIGMHGSWRLLQTEYHVILIHKPYFEEIAQGLCRPKIVFVRDFYGKFVDTPGYYDDKRGWHPCCYHRDTVVIPRAPGRQNASFSFRLDEGNNIVHCGLLALEIAVWMGFNPIYLLGLDLIAGEGHFYDPPGTKCPTEVKRQIQIDLWQHSAERIKNARPRIEVYNANRQSAVRSFKVKTPWD